MTWPTAANAAELARTIRDLRELIEAIDRRLPHVERAGESKIASAAMQLRTQASERIAELERLTRS